MFVARQDGVEATREPAVKSAGRTIDVVEHVAFAERPPTAQAIATALGIPGSSLSYLLATLVERGWLEAGARRTYAIGPKLGGLLAGDQRTSAERAAPVVRWLGAQLNETCGYFEARGDEVATLVSEMGQQALTYSMQVGEQRPLYALAAGKVLLAGWPAEEQEAYLARVELRAFTPFTIRTRAALRRELKVVRTHGHALSEHEHTIGLVSVAMAVGEGQGALSVAVPSVRFNDALKARTLELLTVAKGRLGSG